MGAICKMCDQDMMVADGCLETYFTWNERIYQRFKVGEPPDWSEDRCHDCGAKDGKYHHIGCDTERCPICKGQMLGCSCLEEVEEFETVSGSPL